MSTLLVSFSAANPYLNADGMLNFDAIAKLNKDIVAALKKNDAKAEGVYVMNRKAKPIKYSASLAKKDDFKYTKRRAIKVALRKRITETSLGKVAALLTVASKDALTAKQFASQKQAISAINSHSKKLESVLVKMAKKKAAIREDENKIFNQSLNMLQDILVQGGVKDKDLVVGKGMFGTTMLIRLGPENYVSITKADASRFRAAQKAAKEGS